MHERPSLSISVGRRPSLLQTAAANAAGFTTPADGGSPLNSPHTPANTFDQYFPAMQTPPLMSSNNGLFPPNAFPGRRALLRRNSSLSSVSSSVAEEDDEDEPEWTEEEEQLVQKVYDACLAKHSLTEAPFPLNGPPPPNFTNLVARTVLRAQNAPGRITRSSTRSKRPTFFSGSGSSDVESDAGGSSEVEMDAPAPRWKHSLKNTRAKVLSLAKERQTSELEETPRQCDPDATPRRRKPLARQDSMDFLPDMRNASSISRLGNMLRQPSSDSIPTAPPMMASFSASGTPPCAPSAFSHGLGLGKGSSSSNSNRTRLGRNNSLHTIAGSPSQSLKRTKSSGPSPDKNLLSVPGGAKGSNALKRMSRIGSESSVLPAPTLSRTLSFEPNQRHPGGRAPLGASHPRSDPVAPTSCSSSSLLTPPPASRTSKHHHNLNHANLTIDAGLSLSLKRPQGGLASAFHSPVVGAYPSPQSISPKKKKAKVSSTSPVRQPKFPSSSSSAVNQQDPLASGLGLGLGFGFGAVGDRSSPFVATEEPDQMDHEEHLEIKAMNRPSLVGRTGSFTLLDPSASSSRSSSFDTLDASLSPLTNRHRADSNPPKLVLTPSLSPSSSSGSLQSLSSFDFDSGINGGLCSAFSSDSSAPGTPSHLSSAELDLNALKLESITPPTAIASTDTTMKPPLAASTACGVSPTTLVASPDPTEAAFSFLPPEYVRAGNEAQALRDQFGSFTWARN